MKLFRYTAFILALSLTLSLSGCCLSWIPKPEPLDGGIESTAPADATVPGDDNGEAGQVDNNGEYVDDPATPGNQGNGQQQGGGSNSSTTKQPSKGVMTVTTTTTKATTTKDKSKGKSIKILAIGNSFSVDAMQNHLFPIFESAGYTDITLGNLYIGGCSLDTHYNNLKSNANAYTFYLNTDGNWIQSGNASPSNGFNAAQWDVVTIQQVSTDSGRAHSYANLQKTLDLIKEKEPRAKIFWHMTWAYQQNSTHWAFAHYNKDQMTMYQAITDTVQSQVKPLKSIHGIIPAGTAIQNLRTSDLGDTLTSDGHHLKDTYGDYTAALTWFCTITGEKPEAVSYRPSTIASHWDAIAKSVSSAVKTPYAVTESSYK